MFKKLPKVKVYKDPIHGFISVNYQIIKDLIQTREVQRLRRIRQLGGTLQVFPTSEHSRFSHSLGCYETCRRMIEEVEGLRENLTERDCVAVLCAALLHDVGHGPFSHAFEMVHGVEHEHYSSNIIRKDSEVSRVLAEFNLNEEVATIIDKTNKNKLLVQMVSSQIDADRIDYLLRDAYFTGTSFGYIDVDRLIRMMIVRDNRIIFKERGLSNIENFMLGRYHMYRQVYYHPASLCYEVITTKMLIRYFELAKEGFKFKFNYSFLDPFISGEEVSNDAYFNLDDFVIHFYAKQFYQEDDEILSDLANRFINRKLFKRVYAKKDELEKYKKMVEDKGLNINYYFYSTLPSQVVYKKYGDNDAASIFVQTYNGEVKELSKISRIVNSLSEEQVVSVDDYIVMYE